MNTREFQNFYYICASFYVSTDAAVAAVPILHLSPQLTTEQNIRRLIPAILNLLAKIPF